MDPGSALAHDDRAGGHLLTAERLDPEPLGLGIPAVPRRAAALLVRHGIYRTKELFRGVQCLLRGRFLVLVRLLARRARGAETDLADLDQRHRLSVSLALR